MGKSGGEGAEGEKTLIPGSLGLRVDGPGVGGVFRRLGRIRIGAYPGTSSILLEMFLRLSISTCLRGFSLMEGGTVATYSSNRDLRKGINGILGRVARLKAVDGSLSGNVESRVGSGGSILSVRSLGTCIRGRFFCPGTSGLVAK